MIFLYEMKSRKNLHMKRVINKKAKTKKRIKSPNIIIIGNAPTNLENEFGETIDKFDIIITITVLSTSHLRILSS